VRTALNVEKGMRLLETSLSAARTLAADQADGTGVSSAAKGSDARSEG
jgi:hypothetical protein